VTASNDADEQNAGAEYQVKPAAETTEQRGTGSSPAKR
jgi:hypothetical protein